MRQEDLEMPYMLEKEKQELIRSLKIKHDFINKDYQGLSHLKVFDTKFKIRRKEQMEKDMSQIESDIQKLSKNHIFVDKRNPSSTLSNHLHFATIQWHATFIIFRKKLSKIDSKSIQSTINNLTNNNS